jgi:N-glycosylase/DNA lyase
MPSKLENLKRDYNKKKDLLSKRISDFENIPKNQYIYELFFCILTPQSNAKKCWQAVEELKKCSLNEKIVKDCLKRNTRFYKNKTKYLLEASKKWPEIQKKIETEKNMIKLREWIVENVNGLGMKEASHFLRNIGKGKKIAILDRHILKNLKKFRVISKIPALTIKNYLEIEKKLLEFSNKINIPAEELDLLLWSKETGEIFK